MASDVEIVNRALQLLGAARVIALTDDSVSARAMNNAYSPVRMAALRAHPWNFATKRASLAASATAPIFGPARAFPLPTGFVRLLARDQADELNTKDWKIEQHAGAKAILTDDSAPLEVRYTADVTDAELMDPLFREVLSHDLALACCEEITQSNSKEEKIRTARTLLLREARRTNAIENVPQVAVDDTFVTTRA